MVLHKYFWFWLTWTYDICFEIQYIIQHVYVEFWKLTSTNRSSKKNSSNNKNVRNTFLYKIEISNNRSTDVRSYFVQKWKKSINVLNAERFLLVLLLLLFMRIAYLELNSMPSEIHIKHQFMELHIDLLDCETTMWSTFHSCAAFQTKIKGHLKMPRFKLIATEVVAASNSNNRSSSSSTNQFEGIVSNFSRFKCSVAMLHTKWTNFTVSVKEK